MKHIEDFVKLEAPELIPELYKYFLNRLPDAEGRQYYLNRLNAGYSKASVVYQFSKSPENQSGKTVLGLRRYLFEEKIGSIFNFFGKPKSKEKKEAQDQSSDVKRLQKEELFTDKNPLFDSWFLCQSYNMENKDLEKEIENRTINPSPFLDLMYSNHMLSVSGYVRPENLYLHALDEGIPASFYHSQIENDVISYLFSQSVEEMKTFNKDESGFYLCKIIEELRGKETISRKSENPKISVIIVNYKKPIMTALAVYVVAKALCNYEHEIILFDNEASSFWMEFFYRYFKNIRSLKTLFSAKNLYFGEANNLAMDVASGDYILFLNNDAFIKKEYLDKLVLILDKNSNYSAVCPMFIGKDAIVSEVGGYISEFGDVLQKGKGLPYDKNFSEINYKNLVYEVEYGSAACLLVRKEALKLLGGFDYFYEPLYYEDTDLCMRIRDFGMKIGCVPSSVCLHLENTTTREFLADSFYKQIASSRQKFLQRWVYGKSDKRRLPHFQEGRKEHTLALYTPFEINIGGGENYILTIGEALSEEYNVVLISEAKPSQTRVYFVMQDLGVKPYPLTIYSAEEAECLSFDICVVMGNEFAPHKIPNAKIIYYHCQFPFPMHNGNNYSHLSLVKKIHKYIVNSKFTKKNVLLESEKYAQNIACSVLYPPCQDLVDGINLIECKRAEKELINFVSVGRFQLNGHNKRQDFIAREMSSLSYKNKEIYTKIIGGLKNKPEDLVFYEDIKRQNLFNVELKINVERTVLVQDLISAHYYIHAAGYGVDVKNEPYKCEHFGISLVEAMSAGCIPIVFGEGGPYEICKDSKIGYIFKNKKDFEEIILEIVTKNRSGYFLSQEYADLVIEVKKAAEKYNREVFMKEARKLITLSP